ncbi:hypothetical protein EDC04DRAFT_2907118 [Pisolithus marmoratus]|nr:hypothetical protein EDC04DRAFT_2907118 [Pisolithus marmoratus]
MQEELNQLRTELDRLRKRECELLQELWVVRAAAEIQRQKIYDIVETQSVPVIDSLPVEVFCRILGFALCVTHDRAWDLHRLQKQKFAGVSRLWRDVVLNTPSLWTTICVCSSWPSSFVETHVGRSRGHPLDVTIFEWWHSPRFDSLLRSTCRWRSLTIGHVDSSLLCDLSSRSFPHLKHVHIRVVGSLVLKFLPVDNTPDAERSGLEYFCPPVTLLPIFEKLTTLTLCGDTRDWRLEPQSIHLPLLRSLTIGLNKPSVLLKAVVAPELSYFDLSYCDTVPVFRRIPSVFKKVHHVCLRYPTKDSNVKVCRAFPNVRHLELEEFTSRFLSGLGRKKGLWGDLECVTFCYLRADRLYEPVEDLQEWLRRRKPTAKPFHVRFTRLRRHRFDEKTGYLLSMLYNSLRENCTFEVDQFLLTERARMTSWDRTLHMDLPNVPPCILNMRFGQDVPWHEPMDDFRDLPEDDPDNSEEESHYGGYW